MQRVFFSGEFCGQAVGELHSGSRIGWSEKVPPSLGTLMCYLYSSPAVNALNVACIFLIQLIWNSRRKLTFWISSENEFFDKVPASLRTLTSDWCVFYIHHRQLTPWMLQVFSSNKFSGKVDGEFHFGSRQKSQIVAKVPASSRTLTSDWCAIHIHHRLWALCMLQIFLSKKSLGEKTDNSILNFIQTPKKWNEPASLRTFTAGWCYPLSHNRL